MNFFQIKKLFWIGIGLLILTGIFSPPLVFAGGPLSTLYFAKNRPDTEITLYGPDSRTNVIGSNDDLYPGSLLSGMTAVLEAKKNYIIQVSAVDNPDRDDSGCYRIMVEGAGSSSIIRVPDDTIELTVNGGAYQGCLKSEADKNLYIFRTSTAGKYTITLQVDPSHAEPGAPCRWKKEPVVYNLDRGPLGDLDENGITELIRTCTKIWNDIPTSSFRYEEGPRLETNVDKSTLGVAPSPRFGARFFFDPIRKTLLLFGGYDGNKTYGDVWEWNGTEWRELKLDAPPAVRESYAVAVDKKKNQAVMFGGYGETDLLNDTWTWNGESWQEIETSSQPSTRMNSSMAYDEKRGEIVLFGGIDYTGVLGDTWLWNGEKWTRKTTVSSPDARGGHRLFYDPVLQKVVLFGGYNGLKSFKDQWSWDGSKWTKMTVSNGPIARDSFEIAVDEKRNAAFLFGGYDENSNYLNDTWMWDGKKWTEMASAEAPSVRKSFAMAYDPNRGEIAMFGGLWINEKNQIDPRRDTWALQSQKWIPSHEGVMKYSDFLDQLHEKGVNPIIFDENGELTELIMGEGSKEATIGFASTNQERDAILNGQIFFNGWFLSEEAKISKQSLDEYGMTIIHEFGHFIGVGHSQFYSHLRADALGSDDLYAACMYPFQGTADVPLAPFIHYDDQIAVSDLYPALDGSYERDLGSISGKALFADGKPVLGGVVVARLTSDRQRKVVSRAIDELAGFTGDFRIPGLPSGQYEVWLEAADSRSTGSSDVGYHCEYSKGPAFENPPRPEYYNGAKEGADSLLDNPSYLALVDVKAGQDTPIQFTCEPLSQKKERMAQLLAYGSPMLGGQSAAKRAMQQWPFSVVVTDDVRDLTVTVSPLNRQPLGLRIERDDWVVYTLNGPEMREDANLVYDRKRQRILMYGGRSESGLVNDLWQWDGKTWTMIPFSNGPKARSEFVMAYDDNIGNVVLFGGTDANYKILGDTWLWDGMKWTEVKSGGTPGERRTAGMVYDAVRKKILVFGGMDEDGTILNDLWEYDGLAWAQVRTTNPPSPRMYASMAFDRNRGKTVLFGGSTEDKRLNDTWELDGTRWTQIPTSQAPDSRSGSAIVYDESRKKVFLFGGRTEGGRQSDTWEYENGQWKLMAPAISPLARSASLQGAYDSDRSQWVLFGGLAADERYLRDTWEFDGSQWRDASPAPPEYREAISVALNRTGENGLRLENGTYYISLNAVSDFPGEYSIVVNSKTVDNPTFVGEWELY